MADLPPSSHATANLLAFATVVELNWVIAHVATSWAMPSEVQSAVQTSITIWLTWWAGKKLNGGKAPLLSATKETKS